MQEQRGAATIAQASLDPCLLEQLLLLSTPVGLYLTLTPHHQCFGSQVYSATSVLFSCKIAVAMVVRKRDREIERLHLRPVTIVRIVWLPGQAAPFCSS